VFKAITCFIQTTQITFWFSWFTYFTTKIQNCVIELPNVDFRKKLTTIKKLFANITQLTGYQLINVAGNQKSCTFYSIYDNCYENLTVLLLKYKHTLPRTHVLHLGFLALHTIIAKSNTAKLKFLLFP